MLAALITDDPRHAIIEHFARWGMDLEEMSHIITVDALLESPGILAGSEDEIVEGLKRRRERFGISYYTIYGEENIESFGPVMARLAGT